MFEPRRQRGQSQIEYGLLIALVCLSSLVLFIPTIIVYQWMRRVRHADRTTSFMFAVGFTTLMGLLAHEAKHLAQYHHECCPEDEDKSPGDAGCECCEAGCLCPAFDCSCRCSRDGDRFCCGRESAPCSCGEDCDCCCNRNNCPYCGNCCWSAGDAVHCGCPSDCGCCCNKARCPDCAGPNPVEDEKKDQAERDDRETDPSNLSDL
jgi:hypothetical protein